jgi:hypothetical protein
LDRKHQKNQLKVTQHPPATQSASSGTDKRKEDEMDIGTFITVAVLWIIAGLLCYDVIKGIRNKDKRKPYIYDQRLILQLTEMKNLMVDSVSPATTIEATSLGFFVLRNRKTREVIVGKPKKLRMEDDRYIYTCKRMRCHIGTWFVEKYECPITIEITNPLTVGTKLTTTPLEMIGKTVLPVVAMIVFDVLVYAVLIGF